MGAAAGTVTALTHQAIASLRFSGALARQGAHEEADRDNR